MHQIFAIFAIFQYGVSHGSSATRLRCGGIGILNDGFVAYLLMNLSVKKSLKIGQHLAKHMDNIIVDCF